MSEVSEVMMITWLATWILRWDNHKPDWQVVIRDLCELRTWLLGLSPNNDNIPRKLSQSETLHKLFEAQQSDQKSIFGTIWCPKHMLCLLELQPNLDSSDLRVFDLTVWKCLSGRLFAGMIHVFSLSFFHWSHLINTGASVWKGFTS